MEETKKEDESFELPTPDLNKSKCVTCGETFSHYKDLNAHIDNIHNRHRCELCGASFTQENNLKRHNRAKGLNKCDSNKDKSLKKPRKIRITSITNLGNGLPTKSKCPYCEKYFYEERNLLDHIYKYHKTLYYKNHTALYKKYCKKTGVNSTKKVKNQQKCTYCSEVFPNLEDYDVHIKKNHQDFPENQSEDTIIQNWDIFIPKSEDSSAKHNNDDSNNLM